VQARPGRAGRIRDGGLRASRPTIPANGNRFSSGKLASPLALRVNRA
jgi:hypothetical protein